MLDSTDRLYATEQTYSGPEILDFFHLLMANLILDYSG